MIVVRILLAAVLSCSLACATTGSRVSTPNAKAFMRGVAAKAGRFAAPCGVVVIEHKNQRVIDCMAEKLVAHRPFYGFVFGLGTDSNVATAVALTNSDELFIFKYDDITCDAADDKLCGVNYLPCERASITPDRWISCDDPYSPGISWLTLTTEEPQAGPESH